LAATGDVDAAIARRAMFETRLDRAISFNLATGSEREKLAYLEQTFERMGRTISLHLQQAPGSVAAAELAATTILRRKGRVLDALGGKPRADVMVSLIPNIPQRWRAQSGRLHARTNKAGEFSVRGAPGEYLVFIWSLGQMPDMVDEVYIKAHAAGVQRLTLQPGDRQSMDFVMPPGQN
jgi:hypothetical protein